MKRVTTIIAAVLVASSAFAQTISVRPSFGFNLTHLTNEGVQWNSKEQRLGYQFGAGLMVGDKFYVEPGIYWNTMTKDLYDVNDPNEEIFSNTIHSIRLPVTVGYHLIGDESGIFDLRIFGGAAGSFITSVNSDAPGLEKDDFNSLLLDLHAGVGIDLWILFVEWHYLQGLTPVFNEGANDGKLQGFYGNIGLRFRL
ncbi:MAG: PorT family protein [Flavobacteriia bacterium]|nr:PorT family protein [Flavobacteriia bacterium]